MDLGQLIVIAIVVSLVIWAVQRYFPDPAKMIVTVAIVAIACLWALNAVGLLHLHLAA